MSAEKTIPEMRLPWKYGRMQGAEELARLSNKVLPDHEGYYRENNGDWIVSDCDGVRACVIPFHGVAKRGQGYNAPDLLGQEKCRAVVRSVNNFDSLLDACRAAGLHLAELADAWQSGAISEHDGQGGTRSNRNTDIALQLMKAIQKAESR